MARPTKKSDERIEKILQSLRDGNTRKLSAQIAGISADTLCSWQKESPELMEAIEQAESEGNAVLVQRIRSASANDWRAAAWILERRCFDEWGSRKERAEVEDKLSTQGLLNSIFKSAP